MRTKYNGSVDGSFESLPFGDGYTVASSEDVDARHFAGLDQDVNDNDHALYREYSSMTGRWMSPDPYSGSYNLANPQSLNRYAYVMNNPMAFTDPMGQACVPVPGAAEYTIFCAAAGKGIGAWLSTAIPYIGWGIDIGLTIDDLGKLFGWWGAPQFHGSLTPRPNGTSNAKPGCQAGPLNLSQNIQTAKSLSGKFWSGLLSSSPGGIVSSASAAGSYLDLVKTGGAWDPKTWDGATPTNVAAGNINFGATCSQFGFNTWFGGQVCQFGAGIYGKLTGNYGSPIFSKYHGDWPSDNMQIRQGLAIAKKGGC